MKLEYSPERVLKSRGFFLLILFIFSCNTNREPGWVTDPPKDDDLYIYIVLFTEDSNLLDPIVEVLKSRFGFNEHIKDIVESLLTNSDERLKVIDNWDSGSGIYSLVRIQRSFLSPLRDSLVTSYKDIKNLKDDFETSGDINYEKGELYSAYQLYLSSLKKLLEQDGYNTIPAIVRVVDKLERIVSKLNFIDVRTIGPRNVGEPFFIVGQDDPVESIELFFPGDESFKGFLYNITFQGPEDDFIVSIASGERSFQFVPPMPIISGTYRITGELSLMDLTLTLESGSDSLISGYFEGIKKTIDSSIEGSKLDTSYESKMKISRYPLLVSFNPSIIGEGVVRRLLEDDLLVDFAPVVDPLTREHYLREVQLLASDIYKYLITGEEFSEKRVGIDGDIYQRLEGEYSIIDISRDSVLYTGRVSTEFLLDPDNEDLAYLDIGLLIGESISALEF